MLKVWLPLTKDLRNQGLDNVTVTNNGATFNSAGKLGGCYSFNGSSYITVQDVVLQNIWSYSCWLYSDISSRSWEVVMACNINGGDADMQLGLYTRPGGNVIQNTANGQYNAGISMTYGQWNHFVGTFDGANLKTYLNGVLVDTKAITNAKLDRPKLTIGARCRGSSYDCYFQGLLNDVRIYDHCLSPMEVKELSKGLVLHYPLNRGGWGQENLLLNSNDLTLWPIESNGKIELQEDGYFKVSSKASNTTRYGIYYDFTFPEPNTYTFSVDVKDDWLIGVAPASTFAWTTANLSGTQGKKRISYTCTSTEENNKCRIYIAGTGTGGRVTYLKHPKFEKGSIATPWCPNSSDALATTMGLNGTTEYDTSGYCNNGIRTGTFSWTSDTPKYEVSTHIVNTSTKIHITNLTTSGFGNSYSFAWWGKNTTFSNKMFWGFSDGIRLNGMYSGILWNTGDGSDNPLYKIGTTTQVSAPSVNTWHHYVMTGNGTKCYVYLDGELWAEAKTYKSISGTSIYINGWNDNTSYSNDNMDISDFRIYATALSADDVKSLYQNSAYIDSSGNVYGTIHES